MEENSERLEVPVVIEKDVTPMRIQPSRRAKRLAPVPNPTPQKQTSCKRRGRPPKKAKENDKDTADGLKLRLVDLLLSHGRFSNHHLGGCSKRLSSLPEKYFLKCVEEVLYGSATQRERNVKSYFENYTKNKAAEYSMMLKNDFNKNDSLYESFSVEDTKYDSFDDSLNEEVDEKSLSAKPLAIRKTAKSKSRKKPFYDSLEDVCSLKSHMDKCSLSCEIDNTSHVLENLNKDDSLRGPSLKIKSTSNENRNCNLSQQINFDDDSLALPDIESTFDDSIEEINMISSIEEVNDLENIAELQIADFEICCSSNPQSGFMSNNNFDLSVDVIYERDGFKADSSDKLIDPKCKLFDSLSESDSKDLLIDSLDESKSCGVGLNNLKQDLNNSNFSHDKAEKILSVTTGEVNPSVKVIDEKISSSCGEFMSNYKSNTVSKDNLKDFMNRLSSKENIAETLHSETVDVAKTFIVESNEMCTGREVGRSIDIKKHCAVETIIKSECNDAMKQIFKSPQQAGFNVEKTITKSTEFDEKEKFEILSINQNLEFVTGNELQTSTQESILTKHSDKNVVSVNDTNNADNIKQTITVDACELKFLNDKFHLDQDMKFELEIEVTVGDKKCKIASENIKIIPVVGSKNSKIVPSNSTETKGDMDAILENVLTEPKVNYTSEKVENSLVPVSNTSFNVENDVASKLNLNEEKDILSPSSESVESPSSVKEKISSQLQHLSKSKLYGKQPEVEKDIITASNFTELKVGSKKCPESFPQTDTFQLYDKQSKTKSAVSPADCKPVGIEKRPSKLCLNKPKIKQNSRKEMFSHLTSGTLASKQVTEEIKSPEIPNSKLIEKKNKIISPTSPCSKSNSGDENLSPSKIQRFSKLCKKQNVVKCAVSPTLDYKLGYKKTSLSNGETKLDTENKSSVSSKIKSSQIVRKSQSGNSDIGSTLDGIKNETDIVPPKSSDSHGGVNFKSETGQKQITREKTNQSPMSVCNELDKCTDKTPSKFQLNKRKSTLSPDKAKRNTTRKSVDLKEEAKEISSRGIHLNTLQSNNTLSTEINADSAKDSKDPSFEPQENIFEKQNKVKSSTIPASISVVADKSLSQFSLNRTNGIEETEQSETEEFVSCPESPAASVCESKITRRMGENSIHSKDINVKCGMEDNSLLLALDLHDITLFLNESTIQSNDSLMPLNLCYRDDSVHKPNFPSLQREESKENCSNVPVTMFQYDCADCNDGQVDSYNITDENKTPQNCKVACSKENSAKKASGTKIPIRRIPVFSNRKPVPHTVEKEKKNVQGLHVNGSAKKNPTSSPLKKHHFCNVRNTIFSKVPQIITPKKFIHIQSPVAQYIRNGNIYPSVKSGCEPVLRDCMNNIDFHQQLESPYQQHNILVKGAVPKSKRKP